MSVSKLFLTYYRSIFFVFSLPLLPHTFFAVLKKNKPAGAAAEDYAPE
jgi:hypothetical protein